MKVSLSALVLKSPFTPAVYVGPSTLSKDLKANY
jgi:hypothetical protein